MALRQRVINLKKVDNGLISRLASRLAFHQHGVPSEVVQLEPFEVARPKADQVVLRMLAAPVHPADINTIQGIARRKIGIW